MRGEVALLPLLRLVANAVELPLVASGGIADGRAVAAVLAAGAWAAQIGTAFMLCPEAATSGAHRSALEGSSPTARRGRSQAAAGAGSSIAFSPIIRMVRPLIPISIT